MWLYVLCSLVGASGLVIRDYVHDNSTSMVNKVTGRIKGAGGGRIEQYPYTAQLVVNDNRFCGGVIVSERHILTAAHCVDDALPDNIDVKAGTVERGEGTDIPIDNVLLHPDYDRNFNKDIAILTTTDKIPFSRTINRARIAPEDQEEFDFVTIAGWGYEGPGGEALSDELGVLSLSLATQDACDEAYGGLADENFCTDYFRKREGPCKGDEGGPALFSKTLVGLISVPGICRGQAIVPSLYTALAPPAIHNFIIDNTQGTEEGPGMDD